MDLIIEKMATDAFGVGHYNGKTVLVCGSLPGERVECRITEDRSGYSIAEAVGVITPSPMRREAVCPYYESCGGCDFQIVGEKDSAELKKSVLVDNLRRIGKVESLPDDIPVYYGEFEGYRRRVRFHVDYPARKWGFLGRKSSEIIPIRNCPAISRRLNSLLEDGRILLDEARKAMFSNSLKRDTGHAEIRAFDGDDGLSLGKENVSIDIAGIRYTVNALVFFQSNPSVLPHLLSFVKENAIGDSIMDLYSGVGTFSALFENTGKRVYAVERDKLCLSLSKLNAPSALSFTADVALWGKKNGRHVDTVIVDPPRTGLSREALSEIISWKPERIIYVSCNSSTLSRDAALMADYKITKAAVFDFYPGTGHDESALVLDRK